MSPLANLRFEERSGFTIARIGGEVDASNTASLREDVLAGISNQVTGVILDLSPTSYLDSAGIHLIFELALRKLRRDHDGPTANGADHRQPQIRGNVLRRGLRTGQ